MPRARASSRARGGTLGQLRARATPTAPGCTGMPPNAPKCTRMHPDAPGCTHLPQERPLRCKSVARRRGKRPQMPRNAPKCPPISRSGKTKPPQPSWPSRRGAHVPPAWHKCAGMCHRMCRCDVDARGKKCRKVPEGAGMCHQHAPAQNEPTARNAPEGAGMCHQHAPAQNEATAHHPGKSRGRKSRWLIAVCVASSCRMRARGGRGRPAPGSGRCGRSSLH